MHPPHALQNTLAECSALGSALHVWKPVCQDEAKPQRVVDQRSTAHWYNELVLEKAGLQIFSDQMGDKVIYLSE